jgi:hypothetical protein
VVEKRKKIAVVITHGMGEQIPMETLRSFVKAAWVKDPCVQWKATGGERPNDIWIRPDAVTGSLELRRITTRWTRKSPKDPDTMGPRIDFFEFYWADLAEGTTVQEVWDWLRTLLWPRQVPDDLLGAWRLLWLATVIVTILSLLALSPWPGGAWHAVFAAAALAVGWVMQYVVSPYLGDVARYVRADPRNIAMRRAIRDRGLKLLKDLHASDDYNRIIFVAHSLGTIIAYDLISLFWAEREQDLRISEGRNAFQKLRAVETAAHELDATQGKQEAYRDAQRAFRLALRRGAVQSDEAKRELPPDQEWLISDLVTLGAPLTHAAFLLAKDKDDLDDKIKTYLFPTNPPQFEKIEAEQREKINTGRDPDEPDVCGPEEGLFSYYVSDRQWAMHHAAPFAAVRWTNIYDPHQNIFQGDIISGPLACVFGAGIRDIDLKALRGQSQRFSHTLYWTLNDRGSNKHIDALRSAIDLLDRPDAELWVDGKPVVCHSTGDDDAKLG